MVWILGALGLTGGGIGIAALLGGGPWVLLAAKWLWSWLSHATFLQVVCGVLAIALALDHAGLLIAHRHSAKAESQLSKCTAARHADREQYAKAQANAQAANQAQVTKIETQQQKVTSDVESDYQRKLDLLRRELRASPAAAQSHSNGPAAPALPDAAGRPSGEAGVPLSDAERLRAAEIELQLDELITWVEQQTQIDPNTGAAPE